MNKPRLSPTPIVFRSRLLRWYRRHGRHDLPWRRTWDPYSILVSELMLQQTTVATVIPYFTRFIKRFPNVRSLAKAPLGKVMALWAGLGYYARARHLHEAAQKIAADHGGRMPRTRGEVESLPGVGPYTAGAVLSFAYDRPEALVDGNVIRVLTRVYGVRGNTKSAPVLKRLWETARLLVPPGGARHFNSALMDLGATLCRPTAPDCGRCPLAVSCWAHRRGRQADVPVTGTDPAKKEIHWHLALIEHRGRWLLRQRPEKGLYAGMWEFPGLEFTRPPSRAEVTRLLRERFGARPLRNRPPVPLRHILSHRTIWVHPWICAPAGPLPPGRWADPSDLKDLAVSRLVRRAWHTAHPQTV